MSSIASTDDETTSKDDADVRGRTDTAFTEDADDEDDSTIATNWTYGILTAAVWSDEDKKRKTQISIRFAFCSQIVRTFQSINLFILYRTTSKKGDDDTRTITIILGCLSGTEQHHQSPHLCVCLIHQPTHNNKKRAAATDTNSNPTYKLHPSFTSATTSKARKTAINDQRSAISHQPYN